MFQLTLNMKYTIPGLFIVHHSNEGNCPFLTYGGRLSLFLMSSKPPHAPDRQQTTPYTGYSIVINEKKHTYSRPRTRGGGEVGLLRDCSIC